MNALTAAVPNSERYAQEAALHVSQLVRLLRRYAWLIGAFGVAGGLGAFTYAYTLPKIYTANSLISVEGEQFAIPQLQGALRSDAGPDPMPLVNTQARALTSRALITQVVHQLNLAGNPEFNPDLRSKTLMQRVKDAAGALLSTVLGKGPRGATHPTEDAVIGAASRALSVFQDNKSLVISISFASQDPQLSAAFVNYLVRDFLNAQAEFRSEANAGANGVLERRVAQARADLQAIEQRMQDMRSKGAVIGLRAGSIGQQQVEELTTALARATVEADQLQDSYDRARAAARNGSADALGAVLDSPTISGLREAQAAAQARVADLSSRVGANYPGMRAAKAQLAAINSQLRQEAGRILSSIGTRLRVARDQEADLRMQLDAARGGAVKAENAGAQLDELKNEEATQRALYQSLLEQLQRTAAAPPTSATPDVRVLSPAVPPGFPSGPHVMLAGALGSGIGALIGGLLVLTRVGSARRFESADDVTTMIGLPVLGTIARRDLRRDSGAPRTFEANGVTSETLAEALRSVRHRLRYLGRAEVPRCVAILPGAAGETGSGEAVFGAQLAIAFARVSAADEERVLLVEGNMLRPLLARQLGFAERSGPWGARDADRAADATAVTWRDALVADPQPGLDLLIGRSTWAHGHASLDNVAFQNLLVEARQDYDLVVLSGSPSSTPAAMMAVQCVDAALIVIDGKADPDPPAAAVLHLRHAARTPLGAVFVTRS